MNYKKGTQTRGCMKSVMRYVSQLSKTLWDGQQLVSGIGCQPETVFDEFLSTKLLHHKDGGVMFYHMVQSFPKGVDIDPRAAHEAARRLAGYFGGCEVLVCTHTDREHIHSHCIINSVNFETGKKYIWRMNRFRSCASAMTKSARNWGCRNFRGMASGRRAGCPMRNTTRHPKVRAGSSS